MEEQSDQPGQPLCLGTWPFGAIATQAAFEALEQGEEPLAAAIRGMSAVEQDPAVHSVGLGGLPDRLGQVTLDAAVMESPQRCAGVAFFTWCSGAARAAEWAMRHTPHTLLVGAGADRIARDLGLSHEFLLTDAAKQEWARRFAAAREPDHDTIAVIVRAGNGAFCAATSTSGLANKMHGRVGDSPIIGHGLYAHPRYGAAVCTGTGELASKTCAAFLLVECLRAGLEPREAVTRFFDRLEEDVHIEERHQLGVILMRADGAWTSGALRPGYVTAVSAPGHGALVEPHEIRRAAGA